MLTVASHRLKIADKDSQRGPLAMHHFSFAPFGYAQVGGRRLEFETVSFPRTGVPASVVATTWVIRRPSLQ